MTILDIALLVLIGFSTGLVTRAFIAWLEARGRQGDEADR